MVVACPRSYSADAQHHLSEDVPGRHALVRSGGLRERVRRGDRDLESCRLDGAVEFPELSRAGLGVVRDALDAAALAWRASDGR